MKKHLKVVSFLFALVTLLVLAGCGNIHLHKLGDYVDEKPATCEEAGQKGHYYCEECQKYVDKDGNIIEDLVIPALGHDLKHIEAKDPTCEEAGNIEYWHCERCGKDFSDSEAKNVITSHEVNAIGHDYELVVVWSEDGEALHSLVCKNDSTHVINLGNEGYSATITSETNNSSCTEKGSTVYTITVTYNGKTYTDSYEVELELIDHELTYIGPKLPTAEAAGFKGYYQCGVCHKYFEDEDGKIEITDLAAWKAEGGAGYLEAGSHTHTFVKVDGTRATCDSDGFKDYYECSSCHAYAADQEGTTIIEDLNAWKTGDGKILAYGHELSLVQAKAATETEAGWDEYYVCEVCDKIFEDENGEIEITDFESWSGYHPATGSTGGNGGGDNPEPTPTHPCSKEVETGYTLLDNENLKSGKTLITSTDGVNIYCLSAQEYTGKPEGLLVYDVNDIPATAAWDMTIERDNIYFSIEIEGVTYYLYCNNSLSNNNRIRTTENKEDAAWELIEGYLVNGGRYIGYNTNGWGAYSGVINEITETGYIDFYKCGSVVYNHTLVAKDGLLPNCTEAGFKPYYECSVCHELYEDEQGTKKITDLDAWKALNGDGYLAPKHTLEVVAKVDATEDAAGHKAYYECSVCHKYFEDENGQTEITDLAAWLAVGGEGYLAPIPHVHNNLTVVAGYPATDEHAGYKSAYLCRCGNYYEDENATILIGDADALALWQAKGGRGYEPRTGLTFVITVAWDTDAYTATVTLTCNEDPNESHTSNAIVTSEVTTPATCTQFGVRTYEASYVYGDQTYYATPRTKEEQIEKTVHNYEVKSYKLENDELVKVEKCSICQDEKETKCDPLSPKDVTATSGRVAVLGSVKEINTKTKQIILTDGTADFVLYDMLDASNYYDVLLLGDLVLAWGDVEDYTSFLEFKWDHILAYQGFVVNVNYDSDTLVVNGIPTEVRSHDTIAFTVEAKDSTKNLANVKVNGKLVLPATTGANAGKYVVDVEGDIEITAIEVDKCSSILNGYTELATLTEGKVLITTVKDGVQYYIDAANTTAKTLNTLTDINDVLGSAAWTVTKITDHDDVYYTFSVVRNYSNNTSKTFYLYNISNNDGVKTEGDTSKLSSIDYKWELVQKSNGFALKNNGRFLGIYTSDWRSYTTSDADNYKGTDKVSSAESLKFYGYFEGKVLENHELIKHDAVSKSCLAPGCDAYYECKNCHNYYTSDKGDGTGLIENLTAWIEAQHLANPALGHNIEGHVTFTWDDVNHTCTVTITCDREGCTLNIVDAVCEVSAVTHVTPATCYQTGLDRYTATYINEAENIIVMDEDHEVILPKLDHNYPSNPNEYVLEGGKWYAKYVCQNDGCTDEAEGHINKVETNAVLFAIGTHGYVSMQSAVDSTETENIRSITDTVVEEDITLSKNVTFEGVKYNGTVTFGEYKITVTGAYADLTFKVAKTIDETNASNYIEIETGKEFDVDKTNEAYNIITIIAGGIVTVKHANGTHSNYQTFADALTAITATDTELIINADVTYNDVITVSHDLIINLGQHTLTATSLTVEGSVNVTVANGTFMGTVALSDIKFATLEHAHSIKENNNIIGYYFHELHKEEVAQVLPTCATKGNIRYWYCTNTNCLDKFSDEECTTLVTDVVTQELEALWGTPTYEWNSDHTACVATVSCTREGCTNPSHTITENGIVTSEVTQVKTCENEELTVFTATFTNDKFTTQTTDPIHTADALGHNPEKVEAKAPTCEETGWDEYYECSHCHQLFVESSNGETYTINNEDIKLEKVNAIPTVAKVPHGAYTQVVTSAAATLFNDNNENGYIDKAKNWANEFGLDSSTFTVNGGARFWGGKIRTYNGKNLYVSLNDTNRNILFVIVDGTAKVKVGDNVITKSDGKYQINNNAFYVEGPSSNNEEFTSITITYETYDYGYAVTVTEKLDATCLADGHKAYCYCPQCEKYYSYDSNNELVLIGDTDALATWLAGDGKIAKHDHTMAPTEKIDATCLADGHKAYYYCDECKKYYKDADGTELIGDGDALNAWLADSTENGGKLLKHAHTMTPTAKVDETCTTDGHKAYYYCSECELYYEDENGTIEIGDDAALTTWKTTGNGVIAAHHVWSTNPVDYELVENVWKEKYECSVCHDFKYEDTEKVAKIGTTGYSTLQAAIDAVDSNAESAVTIVIFNDVTLDSLNVNKFVKFETERSSIALTVDNMTIAGNVTFKNIVVLSDVSLDVEATNLGLTFLVNNDFSLLEITLSDDSAFTDELKAKIVVPTGMKVALSSDSKTATITHAVEAMINETGYETLAVALAAANDNDTVKLVVDIDLAELSLSKSITFDLNNKTLTNSIITITENVTIHVVNGILDAAYEVANEKTLTLSTGKYSTITGDRVTVDTACHYHLEASVYDVHANTNLIPHVKVDETCTTAGTKAYWTCSVCEQSYEDENATKLISNIDTWKVIPAHAHNLAETAQTNPEGENAGHKAYWTCSECNKHFADTNGETLIGDADELITWLAGVGARYSVSFNVNGGEAYTESVDTVVETPFKVTKPANPTHATANMTFQGWFKEEGCTNEWTFATDLVTENITLYAKWVEQFTVTFDSKGGSDVVSQNILDGAIAVEPTDPTKDDYTFEGWFTSTDGGNTLADTPYDFATAVSSSFTLYAKWEEIHGTKTHPYTVAEAIDAYEHDRKTSSVYTRGIVTSITEISTQYGNARYTIKDLETNNTLSVFRGKWLDNSNFTSQNQLCVGDVVVIYGNIVTYSNNPQYAQGNYIDTYEANVFTLNVSNQKASFIQNDAYTLGNDVSISLNYVNTGVTSGDVANLSAKIENTDPEWIDVPTNITVAHNNKTIRLTYTDANGKTATYDYTITVEYSPVESITLENVTRTIGSDKSVDLNELSPVILPATANQEFSFNLTSAKNSSNEDMTPETDYEYNTVTKVFTSKSTSGIVVFTFVSTADNTKTVTYTITIDTTIATVDVIFDLNYDDAPAFNPEGNFSDLNSGSKIVAPANPSRTGYDFAGWYKEYACENEWTFATDTVTANTTLYAKWIANTYSVTFDVNGGDSLGSVEDDTATYDSNMPALNSTTLPSREGYTFIGFFDAQSEGTKYYNADLSSAKKFDKTADTALYAQWESNLYTITFFNGNTDLETSVTVSFDSAIITGTLPISSGLTPSSEGLVFGGWALDDSNKTVVIDKEDHLVASVAQYTDANKNWIKADNVRLYAKWVSSGYSLVTSADQITSGNYIIAVKVGNNYISMGKSVSNNKIAGETLSVSNNNATNTSTNTVYITKNNNVYTIMLSQNTYLKYTSSTNLSTQNSGYNWTITVNSDGTVSIRSSATPSRGVIYRAGSTNKFGGYSEGNINGTEYFDVYLFKE